MQTAMFYPIIVKLRSGRFVVMTVFRTNAPRPEAIESMQEFQAVMAEDWCCGTIRNTRAEAEAVFTDPQISWGAYKDVPEYTYYELPV